MSSQIMDVLGDNQAVAIVIKQYLRPVEGEGEPIFPPTYPMPEYRGRVHTVKDGEYRVSVELPPFRHGNGKAEASDSQDVAGYNIDQLRDGTNVCEIDSPQSQANRMEPLFKTLKGGALVPQINIKVGRERVNLLDAGHRAADAVIRMSSLVNEFHLAFSQVKRGNHLRLAQLAPTSLLFGVWDSRGTQVKLPRIVKAEIRATNVERVTRSAQFNPAVDYVGAGAVDENLDVGEGERNPLGAEGMKHVPAPRAAGGVIVLGEIKRVVRISLVAIRGLRALMEDGSIDVQSTARLQRYLLGLALVAGTHSPEFNLREGCLLCQAKSKTTSVKIVMANGDENDFTPTFDEIETYAEAAAKEFFGEKYTQKDIGDAMFESGVANDFLAMSADDRKKVARFGPITAEAIRRFREKGKDPLKLLVEAVKETKKVAKKAIKEAKEADPKYRGRNALPVVVPNAFELIDERLKALLADEQIDQPIKDFVAELQSLIMANAERDTNEAFDLLEHRLKDFEKQRKEGQLASSHV